MNQADIWLASLPGDKNRPVLVVSRSAAIPVMRTVSVVPIMSRIRSNPTCLAVSREHGIDHDSVASFDNLTTVPKAILTRRLGTLGPGGSERICAALEALADC